MWTIDHGFIKGISMIGIDLEITQDKYVWLVHWIFSDDLIISPLDILRGFNQFQLWMLTQFSNQGK